MFSSRPRHTTGPNTLGHITPGPTEPREIYRHSENKKRKYKDRQSHLKLPTLRCRGGKRVSKRGVTVTVTCQTYSSVITFRDSGGGVDGDGE